MRDLFRHARTGLLDLLYPPSCLVCDAFAEPFCEACRSQIRPVEDDVEVPAGLAGVASVGYHEEALRTAVLNLKFRQQVPLVAPLSLLLAEAYRRRAADWQADALVPVPIHWTRRWERGFNQSDLLAEAVGRHLKLPVLQAVQRARITPAQVGLPAADRRRNPRGSFTVNGQAVVTGLRLVLIDDVRTTGSTLAECAAALRAAGAAELFGLTLTFDR